MSRIAGCFAQLAEQGRKAVVPYIVVGDPGLEVTVDIMHQLVDSGADIIELGVPFSDPMSEGPVIQLAHERALANGANLRDALDTVRAFRETNQHTPVLLMGYANPVEHMGYAKFADAAQAAGLDALLTVDIPPEEVEQVNAELQRVGMNNIFLVAPTTPDDRLQRIVDQASGFVYYVSLKGVTGAGHLDIDNVADHVSRIRALTSLPVAVGFGIKDAESAASVASVSDGVVVGSALIRAMAQAIDDGADHAAAGKRAAELLAEIRRGVDSVAS
ncbi:tryptophan synthase subunit alpha [Halioglobus sp. HI00S01]|uniref:tryptophan synthase subunit alpha n=1 Tax=Halioglobus sp. HI00S01 TaxID=1822214 RepID=UPI0007C2756E|nr:tryptophan synthase subunit alpha [Halioglobus sp. HI00S01]KZX60151.1 tryptophan synthase subunit alpha [Halioglobus sp. HI00S01]